eukprot:6203746-Pleurochrysis_carterae.AAC.2
MCFRILRTRRLAQRCASFSGCLNRFSCFLSARMVFGSNSSPILISSPQPHPTHLPKSPFASFPFRRPPHRPFGQISASRTTRVSDFGIHAQASSPRWRRMQSVR